MAGAGGIVLQSLSISSVIFEGEWYWLMMGAAAVRVGGASGGTAVTTEGLIVHCVLPLPLMCASCLQM